MANLYAACRHGGGPLVVKHVQVNQDVQNQLTDVFAAQHAAFVDGVEEDVAFDGGWKPDDDQILVAEANAEAHALWTTSNQNAVALPPLDVANFEQEDIRALFTSLGAGPNRILLVQAFGAQQLLSRKIALLFEGNVFRRLTEPAFALGSHLAAIVIEGGDIKFKSFPLVRRIFDLSANYRAATDAELQTFCGHQSLQFADGIAFRNNADEGVRKFVHAIGASGVLDNNTVATIQARARRVRFPVAVQNGRLTVPPDRKGAKELFSFLLNRVYEGPIDRELFITNSTRRLR